MLVVILVLCTHGKKITSLLISSTLTGLILSPKVFLCLVSEAPPSHHKFIIENKILPSVYYDKVIMIYHLPS